MEEEFDISEVFSPARVTMYAKDRNLKAGYSIDLEHVDYITNKKWDLSNKREQQRLWSLMAKRPSSLIIASPPCTTFSTLQHLRRGGVPADEREHGLELLRVGIEVCARQHRAGRWFLFEHPKGASSWSEPEMQKLINMNGVFIVELDQCMYGLTSTDKIGRAPAKKPTRFITNMEPALACLSLRCDRNHRHVLLENGRARAAQIYPEKLCKAIIECYIMAKSDKQDEPENANAMMEETDDEVLMYQDLGPEVHVESESWADLSEDIHYDENTGVALDPQKVREGRRAEYEKLKGRDVYTPVPRDEAMRRVKQDKNVKFIKTRWVEVEKADAVRCRFVGQEFASQDPREDLFAGTPPLHAARMVVSIAATTSKDLVRSLMALDVGCAFLYAKTEREIYIELPSSDPLAAGGFHVGRLNRALYGTRDAPLLWQKELGKTLAMLDFVQSRLQPGVYVSKSREIVLVSHVDDLLATGPEEKLQQLRCDLQKHYEIKGQTMDEANGKLKFLGRSITRVEGGYEWAGDDRHQQVLYEEWGLENANPVHLPLTTTFTDETAEEREKKEPMNVNDAKKFRRAVARFNYMSLDRPDLAVLANRLSRLMASPRIGDETWIKRGIRYLRGP